ncbi:hypothetical protein QR680_017739 [Steinernema hermaphroditum]|uniref:Uncharacterized protein n=1 Tax=Steinernema hermaphroditum TaxID=289476 RepID=A0AA39HGL4_9BILA|nr:hypothetical protein QR680_017739 [Steinernema hermaphroditum]
MLMTVLVVAVVALTLFYLGYRNTQRTDSQWPAEHNLSQNSSAFGGDSIGNGSAQWVSTHKPLYSSTPSENSLYRRFRTSYENQSPLDRSVNLLSLSGRGLAGSPGDHFLWSSTETPSPKMRSLAQH